MEVWGGSEPVRATVSLAGLDAWVFSRPHGQSDAGGDVYFVSSCATGRINRLLIADVAGHGHSVRDIAIDLRDMMRRFVNFLDQGRFVAAMNRQFVANSRAGIFATAVVTTFFAATRTLSVCNAGHPPPLIYRAAAGQWELLDRRPDGQRSGNIPLGIMELDEYQQFDVALEVGDLVLSYTDCLIEHRNAAGDMLGPAGLLALARELDARAPEALIDGLIQRVEQWAGTKLESDDVTVLIVRPNGHAAGVRIGQALLAPFRIVRSFVRHGVASLPDLKLANVGGALVAPLARRWGRRASKDR